MKFIAFNTVIESDFDLKITHSKESNPEFFIRSKKISLPKKLSKTKIHRFNSTAWFGQNQGSYFLHWPNLFDFEITDKNELFYDTSDNVDPELLRIFLLSEALGLLLFRNGFYILHASAVKIKEEAIVFIGAPGAGKSTTIAAFSKEKYQILSDDLVAIKLDESGKAWVYSAYPEIKIWKNAVIGLNFNLADLEPAWEGKEKFILKGENCPFVPEKVPLSQIVFLNRPFSKISGTINPIQAPIVLLKHFALAHQLLQGEELKKHFMTSLKMAEIVQLKYMKRPKNFNSLITFVKEFSK